MAVSSPRLTSLAVSEQIDPEELGGWEVHSKVSGLVDQVVDTDEEAIAAIQKFLSYLPSHHQEAAPRVTPEPGNQANVRPFDQIVPANRSKVYDMRKVIKNIVDTGTEFELKANYAKNLVTALARIDGRSVGFIANNPQFKGGAIDPDACNKATSFIVLCDSFNIPLVFLVDQPGFLIGKDGERRGATGKVMNWMNALALVTVPKISIVIRKSYGQAVLNMGGAGNADEVAAWTTAEVGFMDPSFGVTIVHGLKREEDPERFDALFDEMNRETTAFDLAACYSAQNVIEPHETHDYLRQILRVHQTRSTAAVGRHLMSTWPTSY